MEIKIEVPVKVAKTFDDVVAHVRSMNPDQTGVTIESILSQECVKIVAGIYNTYLTTPESEDDENKE